MFEGFWEYLQVGYFEPLPKRIILAVFAAAVVIGLMQIRHVRDFAHRLMTLKRSFLLVLLLGLAFGLRVFYISQAPTEFPTGYGQDSMAMAESSLIQIYATDIAKQGIPLTEEGTLAHRRAMGYPYLLGCIYKIFGYHPDLFKWIQVFFGVLTVLLVFYLAETLFERLDVALSTAFLFAIYPQNIIAAPILLDEFPFFAVLFASLIFVAKNLKEKKVHYTMIIAFLIGLASFFRTHAMLVPVLLFVIYAINGLKLKPAFYQAMVSVFFIVVMNLPWGLQVKHHYGVFSFSPPYASIAFYGTLNDKATWHNGYLPTTVEEGGKAEFIDEDNPFKQAQLGRRYALEWVLENPVKFMKLFIMRNFALLGFNLDDEMTVLNEIYATSKDSVAVRYVHEIRKIKAWVYGLVMIYGSLGLIWLFIGSFKDRNLYLPAVSVIVVFLLYWVGIHGALFGFRKYRWFMELMMIFPAAYFVVKLTAFRAFGSRT